MRSWHFASVVTAAVLAVAALLPATTAAQAQSPRQGQPPPAAVKPYKIVPITLPQPLKDAGFEAFRKQLDDAAKRKDRAALAKLVVAQGFFWDRENGDGADKKKPGVDNLAAALGLNNKDGAGWDMLAGYAAEPTVSPSPDHKGASCAPADPGFNDKELTELLKATQTDVPDWGYPVSNGIEVRAAPQASAAVIDKLGLHFVHVLTDSTPAAAVNSFVRVATPSGKTGFVPVDTIAPLGNDQICYLKEAGGWKIGGYIGGGEPQ